MSLFVVLGPYAVLPDSTVTRDAGMLTTCPACADGRARSGRFCEVCGGPVSAQPHTETRPLSHWDLPEDGERFFVLEDQAKVLLYNRSSPHVVKIDRDDRGRILPLPTFTPEESLAWYREQTAHISAWLAANGHPPLTFGYGVVVGTL